MKMAFDYSQLYESDDAIANTWREVYHFSQPFPWNVQNILQQTVFLEYDFYDIIAAYLILPSALSRMVPYLFLYGQSGSGKSNVSKLCMRVHGIETTSPTATYAGLRNLIEKRRYGYADVCHPDEPEYTWRKLVEVNTHLIWEDIDANKFTQNMDLYSMFKIGFDRNTDKIVLSSKEVGENLEFRCFCPKTFSSISPLHLDDRFRELRRRLIVIPFKRVEDLSNERKAELGIKYDNYHSKLIDCDGLDWKGFSNEFKTFWDMELGKQFIDTRRILSKTVQGLTSQQRAISLDLLTSGIVSGIWIDEVEAVEKLKVYWKWFKQETEQNAGLGQLLKEYLKQEEKNAKAGSTELVISVSQLRYQIDLWTNQGWLLEKPSTSSVKELMFDLGMRLRKGNWIKG